MWFDRRAMLLTEERTMGIVRLRVILVQGLLRYLMDMKWLESGLAQSGLMFRVYGEKIVIG